MEGDRVAALTVQAAVEGIIDFRQARVADKRWHQRTRILLGGLERSNRLRLLEARLQRHLAFVANARMTEDSWRSHVDASQELMHDILGCLRPWEGRSYEERKRAEIDEGREAYKEAFGWDPQSEEFKQHEAEIIAKWNDPARRVKPETDDEKVTRRLQERSAEKARHGR